MFTSNAVEYAHNKPFQFKMLLLLLAGLNMLVFQLVTFRTVGTWNEAARTPPGARFAGAAFARLLDRRGRIRPLDRVHDRLLSRVART